MMRGTVSDIGVPIITLSIAGQEWVATIDTSFNGDLELPEALRSVLKPQYVGRMTSGLAGGKPLRRMFIYSISLLMEPLFRRG